MSQFDGSDKAKEPNGPTRWQVALCTVLVTVLVFGLVLALLTAFGSAVSGRFKKAATTELGSQLTGALGGKASQKQEIGKPAQKSLIESEKELASLGIGTVQEVVKAECGVTVVRISFRNKEGVRFGAIAGEGEWKKGDACKLIMIKYSSHSVFPSSPEYVAVKAEVDGYP